MAAGVDKYGRKNAGKSELAGMSDYYYTEDKEEPVVIEQTKPNKAAKQQDSKKVKQPKIAVEEEDAS